MEIIPLLQWSNLVNFLEDKSTVYRTQLMAANCDPTQIEKLDQITEEDQEKNLNFWSQHLSIEPKYHQSIEYIELDESDNITFKVETPVKLATQITVQEWLDITALMEMNKDKILVTYPNILSIISDLTTEQAQKVHYRLAAEHITFFLKNYTQATKILLKSSDLKILKKLVKMKMKQLGLGIL